ncbi:family 31 glycoside hydrolase [Trichoderma longibrachiatum]|uniref:alpha-D-xyloside xylohydrolase n=1 Tax=Trichoderma longibrachiatum ATCC 18648 TaxID=983965 RepID=A0A2T4BR96_TRILO|nr:glycoside hydrolase family 31 protein [Trichoderma longibrachiatum ATCC 18648]
MRFRNGMWLPIEGKRTEYAEDIYTITKRPSGLSLLCPTKHIRSRGDTLNLPTVTIDIEAVFDGVLSVEVTHWSGAVSRGPHFDLFPEGRPQGDASISVSAKGTTLRSGSVSATVHPDQHTFDIRFHATDGSKQLTSLLNRSVGFAYSPVPDTPVQLDNMSNFDHYIFTQTTLSVGETVHGLGERFGAFNKVGQSVILWNNDGGTSSEQAYKNVPFYLSSRGFGIFIDTPDEIQLEVGSERLCRVQTSVKGQRLKWYLIYGPSPKEVLYKYTTLTGRAGRVPSWSFGLWLSTSFTTSYDEKTVSSFLEGMAARDIPVEVFHYDCFWLKAFHWCDFVWDQRFDDPKGMIARLTSSGLVKKVCVWTNPYLGQASPVFKMAAEKGFLLKRRNGDIWQTDLWQAGMGLVDFTNPEATRWFASCLESLFDTGVSAIKTDFGERIPVDDVAWYDKTVDNSRMHNFYSFMYNKVVYDALQKRYGKSEAVVFARASTAGCQRFPLQWGGDCESTAEAMAESLRGGLSLGLCGFSFWSVDIGGFEGYPSPWLYKRWVAFGLLTSHSRLHGSNSYRVPWMIDADEAGEQSCTKTLARWTALKARLMPYLYAQAAESIAGGLPLSVRAMCLEFPEDPTSWYLDRQFMLGSRLLVAPVFEETGEVEFYLPRGNWTDFFTGQVRVGPGWIKEIHNFDTLPLYVRENTVLVMGKEGERRTVYNYLEDVEVRLYHTTAGDEAQLVDSEGNERGTLQIGANNTVIGKELLQGNSKIQVISGH